MEIFIRGLVALGIALAVAAYGFSDTVKAPSAAPAGAAAAPTTNDNGCGWAPCFKHLFCKGGNCGHGLGLLHGSGLGSHGLGHGGHGYGDPGDPNQQRAPIPRTQPGTVVFPQHPFARSPRDFFMVD